MDIFDDIIVDVRKWFSKKVNAGLCRVQTIPTGYGRSSGEALPKEKPPAPTGILLKSDTHLELGHPSTGSCSGALATFDRRIVDDGRISLVGPDVPETLEDRLPFAQVIVASLTQPSGDSASAAATGAIDRIASRMDRVAHTHAQTDGYMIRSVPNLIWARVGKDAAAKGFSLFHLGERLIRGIRHSCENISACEVYFATSSRQDVDRLDEIMEKARAKTQQLESFELGADGEYECTRDQDCGVCPEQVVCDNIRDVINIRKGDRVITIEKDKVSVRTEGM